ncbi:MAG: hypothetical protein ACI3Y9_07935 [Candidatus Cryptobacteroides sp.]
MRSFLSKFCGMFLAGALFAVAGCTDYDEDIREINNKLDDEVAVSISNLDDAIKSLEAKMQSDYALKSEVSELKSSLESKINDEVVKLNASIASIQKSLDDLASKAATKDELASAKAELKSQIDKAVSDANAAIYAINEEITKLNANKADKSELEALKGTLEGEIASVKAELEGKITALGTSVSELGEALEELGGAVEDNTTAISDNAEAIKALNEALKSVGEQITGLQGQIIKVNTEITGIKSRLDDVEKAIEINKTQVSNLLNDMKALKDRVDQNERDIEAANDAIDKNAGAISDNAKLIAANKRLIEANKNAIDLNTEAILALQTADGVINGRIDELQSVVSTHIAAYGEHITAYNAFIEQYAQDKLALENKISNGDAAVKAWVEGQLEGVNGNISALEDRVDALDTAVGDLMSDLSELEGVVSDFKDEYDAYTVATDSALEELDKKIDQVESNLTSSLNSAVSSINDAIAAAKKEAADAVDAANKKIDDAKTELEDKIDALDTKINRVKDDLKAVEERVAALEVNVDKLLSRVQSLVYIPDYSDGKADINVLLLENKEIAELSEYDGVTYVDQAFIEGTSVLRYKVSPAKYAADLAKVAAEVFSYDVREVKIRTRAAAVPEMTVVSAECVDAASGEIAVTVKTRNFGDAFYTGENSYSAALVLVQESEEESRNISSEFTNLVPAVEAVEFKILDANEENDLTNVLVEEALEFPYNSRLSQDVLKGHHPVFVLGNENKTPAEMVALGYEIALEQAEEGIENPADNGVATDDEVAEPDGCFVFTTKEDPRSDYMEVKLADEVGKDNIGHNGRVTYTYTVNGVEFFTAQNVVITKEKATVKADDVTINWTYVPDAKVDADKLANVATAQYSRVISLDALTKDGVPADIEPSLYDILTGTSKITINGSEVVATSLTTARLEKVVDGENSSLVLHFDGFDWGTQEKPNEYNVKFEVSTDDIDITFTINITTVDRNREPLTVAIEPATEAEYVKNVVIRKGEYKYSLEPVFDALVENENLGAGDMTAADYFKEIFATEGHDNTNIINTIYGKQRSAGLAFMIDEDSYEISPEYNYAWFDTPEVDPVVPLTKTFTTWYGQVITIEHTLNFTLPGYDFEHVPAWVKKNEGSSDYYSRVMGKYAPGVESPAVSAFSVTDIDLDAAFDVIDAEGARLDTDALAELGLVTEFEIETENHGTGIVMTDNVLSYNDKDPFVDVKGNLYLVNDNDTRVQLPTNFDAGNKYSTYVVKKYDPIGKPVLNGEAPKIDVVDSKVYTVNMLDYITLKDNRDGREAYDLIVDGKWLTGNGENGYAAVSVTRLYGLEINYSAVQDDIPVEVRKFFNFNEETGVLTFDASDNLTLVNEIVVPVTMIVDYTWGTKEIVFNVTFFRSNGDRVE